MFKSHIQNLIDLTELQAKAQPDKTAFTILADGEHPAQHISFGELPWYAKNIAARLQELNLTGQCALLLYPTGIEFIVAFFACLYAGVIAIPAYPPDPTRLKPSLDRLKHIINDAKPAICLTSNTFCALFESILKDPHLPLIKCLSTDNLESNTAWKYPDIHEKSIAYLQYTSGSIRRPKGVMITHHNTLSNLALGKQLNAFTKESRIVGWVPLYHDLGLIAYVIGTIYNGAHCYLMSPHHFIQKPCRWLQAISRFRATHNAAPPFGYELCVRKVDPQNPQALDLSCWKVAGIGAQKVHKSVIDQFSRLYKNVGFDKKAFVPTYGMAESVLYISGGHSPEYFNQMPDKKNNNNLHRITSCGTTNSEHRILIVDPSTKMRCEQGTTGEIWLMGPSVASGYYLNPAQTQKTFQAYLQDTHEGPFLRTGDLGFINNNQLFVSGRLKDVIIMNGQNIYPDDLEFALQGIDPMLKSGRILVFSYDSNDTEKMGIACETKSPIQKAHPDKIIELIKDKLWTVSGLLPDIILFLKAGTLPKTSSGKLQRQRCKNNFLTGRLQIEYLWKRHVKDQNNRLISSETTDNFEKQVKTIQHQIMMLINEMIPDTITPFDMNTTVEDSGIDSIRIGQLLSALESFFDIRIHISRITPDTTIEQLSRYIGTKLWPKQT
jgi:acyl-CoA synthetase (AMP-forming)/AMP-acid ligase II/acyl carrier protein